ncbi:MAG: dihydropteroate synthase, partial [Clostridia bacterium]|nr:dihydropteroate synthase [Clostridia bacterium]
AALGAAAVGGCCGTTPEYISALTERLRSVAHNPVTKKQRTVISSYTHAVEFADAPVLIGERINPTGKKRFKEALRAGDMDYILKEGISEEEAGAQVLDVNVGLPEIDEVALLTRAVRELQAVIDLPLQIDTSSTEAMESALRVYNGKPMINSVSGKPESMAAVFPLAKKYGGVIVALTLDESGIPADACGRVKIARKILAEAEKYGIDKKDLIFDPLALTVSADRTAAVETLRAVRMIREELGCHTSLGVSNVSFGLPERDAVNASFFALALANGLSAAIMNPHSTEMMKTYRAYLALSGLDEGCAGYIAAAEGFATAAPVVAPTATTTATPTETAEGEGPLDRAIRKGLRGEAAALTEGLLRDRNPLSLIREEIVPALNAVGLAFEEGRAYLPSLLVSAEAASAALAVIKTALLAEGAPPAVRGPFVLATVRGDIHDIGKNIVRLLLESYGFRVIDLGRDVAPRAIVDAVLTHKAPLCGLSALMTTTVPAMRETVALLREEAPFCHVVVGGAVLTEEAARAMGAHHYAPDAMDGVRYAESICK